MNCTTKNAIPTRMHAPYNNAPPTHIHSSRERQRRGMWNLVWTMASMASPLMASVQFVKRRSSLMSSCAYCLANMRTIVIVYMHGLLGEQRAPRMCCLMGLVYACGQDVCDQMCVVRCVWSDVCILLCVGDHWYLIHTPYVYCIHEHLHLLHTLLCIHT